MSDDPLGELLGNTWDRLLAENESFRARIATLERELATLLASCDEVANDVFCGSTTESEAP